MAIEGSTHVSLFRIEAQKVGDHHWAIYDYRVNVEVASGGAGNVIQDAVASSRLPNGGDRPLRPSQLERYLDILETRPSGQCTYAFYLNATVDQRLRMRFARGHPFIALPMNFELETFLTNFQMEYGTTGRWASFDCNLDDVRGSALAERIKNAAKEQGEEDGLNHVPIMTIPFCFNVADPVLGASPWVVPRHSDVADLIARNVLTHGGIHPSAVAYLSVPL
jgi:hypothetical protein